MRGAINTDIALAEVYENDDPLAATKRRVAAVEAEAAALAAHGLSDVEEDNTKEDSFTLDSGGEDENKDDLIGRLIVINASYGGFSISQEMRAEWCKRKGLSSSRYVADIPRDDTDLVSVVQVPKILTGVHLLHG